jgi:hypothetical protein
LKAISVQKEEIKFFNIKLKFCWLFLTFSLKLILGYSAFENSVKSVLVILLSIEMLLPSKTLLWLDFNKVCDFT